MITCSVRPQIHIQRNLCAGQVGEASGLGGTEKRICQPNRLLRITGHDVTNDVFTSRDKAILFLGYSVALTQFGDDRMKSVMKNKMKSFRKGLIAVSVLLLILLSACGGTETTPSPTQVPTAAQTDPGSRLARPVLASSELVVGPERFVFGIIDPVSNQPIQDVAEVTIQFFKVHEDGSATKVGDATPIFHSENLPKGVYVARTTFNEAGAWGALMTISREGQDPYQVRANFEVLADSTVPMIGEAAPLSKNQTVKDVKDIGLIDSALPHDDMHDMTIADAVSSGKPTIILFAAPGYCPSFTCGPDMELMESLKSQYAEKANFIHIESPNTVQTHTHEATPDEPLEAGHQGVAMPQVRTADEWGLVSEPWLFLVDKDGKIFERLEGGLTAEEVGPQVQALISPAE